MESTSTQNVIGVGGKRPSPFERGKEMGEAAQEGTGEATSLLGGGERGRTDSKVSLSP